MRGSEISSERRSTRPNGAFWLLVRQRERRPAAALGWGPSVPRAAEVSQVEFQSPFLPNSTSAKSKNRSEKRSTRRVQRCVGRRAAMVGSRNGSRKSGGYTDGAARSACGSARPPGRLARRPWPARVAAFVPSIKASGVTSLSVSSTSIVDFLRPRRARARQEVAVAARSRAGGAARCRFPTLESGSAVRVGSVAGRTSRRRRLVSGRRPQEAAGGAKSCCSSGAMQWAAAAVAPPAAARSTSASRRGAQRRPAAAADRARPRDRIVLPRRERGKGPVYRVGPGLRFTGLERGPVSPQQGWLWAGFTLNHPDINSFPTHSQDRVGKELGKSLDLRELLRLGSRGLG